MLAIPQVRASLAEAEALTSNWKTLAEKLDNDNWQGLEPLRLVYLSRAHERLGNEDASNSAWMRAVQLAQRQSGMFERLGKLILRWGWKQKAEQLFWRVAAAPQCPRWVADSLWNSALEAHDTLHLYDASKLILKADPKNSTARTNYIALALLIDRSEDSPEKLAFDQYEKEPENPRVVANYGYSLFVQGQASAAAEIMKKLKPEQLHDPLIAFYHGLFLAAAGRLSEAKGALQIADRGMLLPEQIALLDRALAGDESLKTPRASKGKE
jgi:Flp pilus assembly protein TadD